MRPPSKHGLERKFKPWRRGKSSSARVARGGVDGGSKRPPNASLKNRLRGQKRLLAKLQKVGGNDNDGDGGNTEEAIEGVRRRITQLERDISAHESREREKKNSAKYHQVKFIERQKLTRLEKSVNRQLQQLQRPVDERPPDQPRQEQISRLQQQLQSIAMDQLYIAFYPTNMKYMALFTNGMDRVLDDKRGRRRRQGVWNDIRQGLLRELKEKDRHDVVNSNSDSESSGGGDICDGGDKDEKTKKKFQLSNAKKWVNLDVAKKALLSMPADTFPNASYVVGDESSTAFSKNRPKIEKKKGSEVTTAKEQSASNNNGKKRGKTNAAASSDGRFTLSKELDGLFRESTTGEDYQREMKPEKGWGGSHDDDGEVDSDGSSDDGEDDSSLVEDDTDLLQASRLGKKKGSWTSPVMVTKQEHASSSSSSSDSDSDNSSDNGDYDASLTEDDADPPKGFGCGKKEGMQTSPVLETKQEYASSSSSPSDSDGNSDSNSDSYSDRNSDSDSDSSDSDTHHAPPSGTNKQNSPDSENFRVEHGNEDGRYDDFFTTDNKVSAEDIFMQAQNDNDRRWRSGHLDDDMHQRQKSNPDKSRGFASQKNQSRREYRAFRHRQKRQKFG